MSTNGKNGNLPAEGAGDLEATRARIDALYRQHNDAVSRICRALLRDRAEAEDATQQVFLSAHRALLSGIVPYEPAAWLATIARRECWARARAEMSTLPPEAADGVASDVAADALRRAEVTVMWSAIAELPSMQRDAFLLREIRGLSYGQLEQQLARSGPSVRSLLARARRRLRLRLQDVHTALGGAPWFEPLARLVTGGSNPAAPAVRAAALGLGAAAVTGGALIAPTALEHRVRPPSAHAAARPAQIAPRVRAKPRVAVEALRAEVVVRRVRHRSGRDASRRGERTERAEVQDRSDRERSDEAQAAAATTPAESDSSPGSASDGERAVSSNSGDHGDTTTSRDGSDDSVAAIAAPSNSGDGGGASDESGSSGDSSGSGDSGGD